MIRHFHQHDQSYILGNPHDFPVAFSRDVACRVLSTMLSSLQEGSTSSGSSERLSPSVLRSMSGGSASPSPSPSSTQNYRHSVATFPGDSDPHPDILTRGNAPHPSHKLRPTSLPAMEPINENLPLDTTTTGSSSTDAGMSKPRLFDMRLLTDALEQKGLGGHREPAGSLDEALRSLQGVLEDYQGQYPELQILEEQIHRLDRMLVG